MKSRLNLSMPRASLLNNIQPLELRAPYSAQDFQSLPSELASYGDHIRTIALAFFIVGLIAICSTLSFQAWLLKPEIIDENELLELIQCVLLLMAALLQSWKAFNTQGAGLKRDIHLGLALFTFSLFLREVDINSLGSSALWNLLEIFLRLIALTAAVSFTFHMSRRLDLVKDNLGRILLSPMVLLSALASVFYACGFPFDRELIDLDRNLSVWFEETFELNACLLFFCASLAGNIKSVVVSNTYNAVLSLGCHEQSSQ